jgi:hypothetical protein
MKILATILGILGGIGGGIVSVILIVIGNLGIGLGAPRGPLLTGRGWAGLLLSLLGIAGGALAISRPKIAGILMLVSALGGFIALMVGYVFGGPLLIAGGVLALVAARERPSQV